MNHHDDEITRDLTDGAERFEAHGGRERSLDEVLGTARSIRRRRRAGVALAAAAVVAAVGIPVGLTATAQHTTTPPPATTTTPTPPVRQVGLGDLPVGRTPATGWVLDGTWHRPKAGPLAINHNLGDVRALAPTRDGAVVSIANTAGGLGAWLLHDDGKLEELAVPMEGGLARSDDGHLVAFVGAQGRPTVVANGQLTTLTGGPASTSAVAVTGEDCTTTAPGCVVWLNDQGPTPKVVPVASAAGVDVARVPRIDTLADVAADGRLAGIVSRTDAGTCSEVQRAGQRVWGTCAARFVAFSPDGTRLLGTSAYGDGGGDTQLAVFDARTGHPELNLRTTRGAAITQMSWEDDGHLLVAVRQGNRAGILRIGVDGRAEYAVPPVPASGDVSPFLLPVS